MEGGLPNMEKIYEQKYSKKMTKSLLMLLGLFKSRDRQLVGIMNKAVIPIQLVQAKNWYQHRIKNAKSERFKAIIDSIYVSMISPLVDAFMPYPIPIDTILKDYATEQGELDVVGTPKLPKRKHKKSQSNKDKDFFEEWADGSDEDDIDKVYENTSKKIDDRELDILKEELHEQLGESFTGPFEGQEKESPFITFGSLTDEEED